MSIRSWLERLVRPRGYVGPDERLYREWRDLLIHENADGAVVVYAENGPDRVVHLQVKPHLWLLRKDLVGRLPVHELLQSCQGDASFHAVIRRLDDVETQQAYARIRRILEDRTLVVEEFRRD